MTNQSDQFAALADPTRLAVFERVAKGPAAVHQIAKAFPVSRPAISQHLRVLKDAGLVFDQQIGNRRIYQLNPDGIESLRDYFDRFWVDALESFKAFAENTKPKKTNPQHATNKAKRSQSNPRKR